MRISDRTYVYKSPLVDFKCTLYHKFNFVHALGARGKSYFISNVKNRPITGNVAALLSRQKDIDFDKEYDDLFIIDEDDLFVILKNINIKRLLNSPNVFLIFYRDIPKFIPVHYLSVYDWVAEGRVYSLKNKKLS